MACVVVVVAVAIVLQVRGRPVAPPPLFFFFFFFFFFSNSQLPKHWTKLYGVACRLKAATRICYECSFSFDPVPVSSRGQDTCSRPRTGVQIPYSYKKVGTPASPLTSAPCNRAVRARATAGPPRTARRVPRHAGRASERVGLARSVLGRQRLKSHMSTATPWKKLCHQLACVFKTNLPLNVRRTRTHVVLLGL